MSRSISITIFGLIAVSLVLANSHEESRDFKGRTVNLVANNIEKQNTTHPQLKTELRSRGGHKLKYIFPFLFGMSTSITQNRFIHAPIWGYSGFYTVAALIALKFKLVIIALFIFGAVFYGFKVWAGKGIGCPEPSIVKEPFYPHGITAYSSHSGPDAGLFSGQISYSNPYESYPSYHSDINSHHYGSDIVSSDPYPTDAAAIAGSDIPPSGSGSIYRRNGGRQKRQINQDEPVTAQDEFIGTINPTGYDFTELIFTVLGVNTPQCRKRFTCEVDFMARRDPLIQIGFRFLGSKLFANYRNVESKSVKRFRQCAKLNPECKTPQEEEIESEANSNSIEVDNNHDNKSETMASNKKVISTRRKIWRI